MVLGSQRTFGATPSATEPPSMPVRLAEEKPEVKATAGPARTPEPCFPPRKTELGVHPEVDRRRWVWPSQRGPQVLSKGIIRGKRLVHLYSLDNQRPKQQQQTAQDSLVLERLPLPRPAPPVPTAPRWLHSDMSQRLGQAREAAPDDSRQSPKGNGTWNIFLPRSLTENETCVQVVRTGQTRDRLFQAPGTVPRGESGFDISLLGARQRQGN